MSTNRLFRALRKLCYVYIEDLSLGELQELVSQLQQRRRQRDEVPQ